MADVKWIKITTDIFDDEKILLIESLPDSYAIITVWFKLLCLAGKQNNSGVFMMGRIAYTDKMLATIFRMKETTVTMALQTFEQFGMIEIVDGVITIPNWGKHQSLEQIEARREYQREYQKEYRKRQKLLAQIEDDDEKTLHKHLCKQNVNSPEVDKEIDIEKEKDKKSVRETTHSLYKRLLPHYIISDKLQAKVEEWITYKTQRKEPYQEQGLKTLLRRLENNAIDYGDEAVCDLIDESMANGWKGIIFDRLKNNLKPQGRKEVVPSWMNKPNKFHNYQQRDTDYDKLTAENDPLMAQAIKTAANDKSIRERAEALKKQFAE